jgi:ADP-glucose type glycogen/starch synthase
VAAKAGGLADVSASLVSALFDHGADVHVALPNFRRMFNIEVTQLINQELRVFKSRLNNSRIHLAEDRSFYYMKEIYSGYSDENPKIAMAFQREVINNIVPEVKPDLIHCNDWMTGLIPAMARRMNIPCLFTVHNIHTRKLTLAEIEDRGIDAAEFWPYLYYEFPPGDYESCRDTCPVDLLASGIFGAHFINTVSPTFLKEIADGRHAFVPGNIRQEIAGKLHAGCAAGILNAPDENYNPATDDMIQVKYDPATHAEAKKTNKRALQKKMGLEIDESAPILFWPSRLDPVQKGCQLLSDILYRTISDYWNDGLQLVVVANGAYQEVFRHIAGCDNIRNRMAVANCSEKDSRLGYAASDFLLMPSLFEPCGLPQMVGPIYGSLPIAHDTGGLHDTVTHLSSDASSGNGFVFHDYDANALRWGIDEALSFYRKDASLKNEAVSRIMTEALSTFNHAVCAQKYIEIYEDMLHRPLITDF